MSVRYERAGPIRVAKGLVLVHGRGGGAQDILGLGQALGVPDVAMIAPEHPNHSWWPTSFLAPTVVMEPHVAFGLDAIEGAIGMLVADGVPRDQVALAGFSQGACLALEYAARKGGVSAVFGLSGGLVGTGDAGSGPLSELYGHEDKTFDYAPVANGVPVVIELHESDPHIPLARARRSVSVFDALGASPKLHLLPGSGHGIGKSGMAAMRAHLNA